MTDAFPSRALPDSGQPGRKRRARRRNAQHVADLLPGALRSLGVPSARLSQRIQDAWEAASESAWRDRTSLLRIQGGVLDIGVSSAVLRDELANFHRARLLEVLRTALPDVPLIGLRFVSGGSGA